MVIPYLDLYWQVYQFITHASADPLAIALHQFRLWPHCIRLLLILSSSCIYSTVQWLCPQKGGTAGPGWRRSQEAVGPQCLHGRSGLNTSASPDLPSILPAQRKKFMKLSTMSKGIAIIKIFWQIQNVALFHLVSWFNIKSKCIALSLYCCMYILNTLQLIMWFIVYL